MCVQVVSALIPLLERRKLFLPGRGETIDAGKMHNTHAYNNKRNHFFYKTVSRMGTHTNHKKKKKKAHGFQLLATRTTAGQNVLHTENTSILHSLFSRVVVARKKKSFSFFPFPENDEGR